MSLEEEAAIFQMHATAIEMAKAELSEARGGPVDAEFDSVYEIAHTRLYDSCKPMQMSVAPRLLCSLECYRNWRMLPVQV